MNELPPLTLLSIAFTLGLVLTVWVRTVLVKRMVLDHPNKRSSHTTPVPRGGGWAVLGVVVPGMMLAAIQHGPLTHAGLILGTIVLAFVSWLDDRGSRKGGASIILRLSLHIFAACLGSLAFSPQQTLFGGVIPFEWDRIIMIVGWVWFMNLYNFMDGIDGITGVETISLATGVCFLMIAAGINDPFLSILTLLLGGACLGFLALNWYPAKIFLGDVGSVPLGFLTGYLVLSLAVKGYLIPALVLPLYYLADSGITLTRRALRREKIWQSHRQHFYQQAALVVKNHSRVVTWVLTADIALIFAALIAFVRPLYGFLLAVLIVAILLRRMHKAGKQ